MSLYAEATSIYRTTELVNDSDHLLDLYTAAHECGGVAIDLLPMDTQQARESIIACHIADLQLNNPLHGLELNRRAYDIRWAVENGARIVELVVSSGQIDGGPNLGAFKDILYDKRVISETLGQQD